MIRAIAGYVLLCDLLEKLEGKFKHLEIFVTASVYFRSTFAVTLLRNLLCQKRHNEERFENIEKYSM